METGTDLSVEIRQAIHRELVLLEHHIKKSVSRIALRAGGVLLGVLAFGVGILAVLAGAVGALQWFAGISLWQSLLWVGLAVTLFSFLLVRRMVRGPRLIFPEFPHRQNA